MASSAAGRKNPLTNPNFHIGPSFWVTPMGRTIVGGVTAATAGAYFGGLTVLHTWFLDKHGFPTPLPSEVVIRCHQTVDEMNLKLKNQDYIVKFFCVFGMDMFHAGSTKFRGGSIVGVPRCFAYKTVEDIEKNDVVVENKPIEWGSDGGQLLQDALIISERAQKFAIAREVAMSDTHRPYVDGVIGVGSLMTYCLTTRFLNDKFHGLIRPKSFRVFMYSLVGTFSFGLFTTATDLITKYYENYADKVAGRISLEYAKGGVEFYSKTLERNIALRSLMGPSGEKRFTYYGNDVEFIRQKHVPFTGRKANLESIATELSSAISNTSQNND